MPVLGSGNLKIPEEVFVHALKKAVLELNLEQRGLEHITVCEFNP
jgi:hypothetical protein